MAIMFLSEALKDLQLKELASFPTSLLTTIRKSGRSAALAALPPVQTCPACGTLLGEAAERYMQFAVCDECGHHFLCSSQQRLLGLVDDMTFKEIGPRIWPVDVLKFADEYPYAKRLADAQKKTGLNDAVLAGRCRIGGCETVLVILDFRFLGGSMGSVMGERVATAFEYAIRHHLPVVTIANSGGARMQEGMLSLVQLAKTSAAVQRFHDAGLLYLSVLASPTTGGVFASFASLGDVIIAEPRALIGFAGPRVVEQTTGEKLPPDSHTAEFLLEHGHLDAIVARQDLPQFLGSILQHVSRDASKHIASLPVAELPLFSTEEYRDYSAWEIVQLARHPERPTALDYIRHLSPHFLSLHGDRCYGDDPAIIAGLGEIAGHTVMFIGQQSRSLPNNVPESGEIAVTEERTTPKQLRPRPEGYRKALRVMQLAGHLRVPLVTFIDTAGADPGIASEQHGLASTIARCLADMSVLPVPIVAALIGEGGSGGALALGLADQVLMLQYATYEVIAPEGAAAILYRDAGKAEQVASRLKCTAPDCLQLGVVDAIIPEPPAGAHTDPDAIMQILQVSLLQAIIRLQEIPVKKLLARRYQKFRGLGKFEDELHFLVRRVSERVPTVQPGVLPPAFLKGADVS